LISCHPERSEGSAARFRSQQIAYLVSRAHCARSSLLVAQQQILRRFAPHDNKVLLVVLYEPAGMHDIAHHAK